MPHLDEGTIHAWLDGALSPEQVAAAEAHVTSCGGCADAVAEARGLIAASSRILTALDTVPSIRSTKPPGWGRRPLTTWLVREKIAAVMTLVVAGGALALVLARDTPESTQADLALEPVAAMELAATDSPVPAPAASEELRDEAQTLRTRPRLSAAPPPATAVASNREGDSTAAASLLQQSPTVVAEARPGRPAATDDSIRALEVATAQRAEARASSAQAGGATAEKVVGELARRRAVDASARYARPAAPDVGGAVGASAPADGPRLVQEEKMTEEGREIRRRIYRVEGLLVTLDERPTGARDLAARAPTANTTPADTTALSATIRWTDAKGAEFTLTGPATRDRLEQIRKLLGYE